MFGCLSNARGTPKHNIIGGKIFSIGFAIIISRSQFAVIHLVRAGGAGGGSGSSGSSSGPGVFFDFFIGPFVAVFGRQIAENFFSSPIGWIIIMAIFLVAISFLPKDD